MKYELIIDNKGKLQAPAVIDGMTWTTERKGVPGKLTFQVIKDHNLDFQEGNVVRLTVDSVKLFYGFVFTKKRDKQHHIEVTAYDQIRYLLNKDTYVYKEKTAGDVLSMIAEDFNLQLGNVDNTSFVIPQRAEDNKSLLDIIYNALDLELSNKKRLFILYDDFGKLTLKSIDNMLIDLILDDKTAENFEYSTSIDENTYNKVKLSYENEDTGKRDIYVVQDGNHINEWGILQYFNTLQEGENGDAKAQALLELYNTKTRKLKLLKVFGDLRVRAGSMIIVNLMLGDIGVKNYMLVEKCVHTFNEGEHYMDLTLVGGEFIG